MTRAQRIEQLFDDALDLPTTERDAFLREHCGDDEGLRREVAELLAADDEADGTVVTAPKAEDLAEALAGEDPMLGASLGAWTLDAPLGAGGMGRVYLASRRADFEQRAAVKLIRRELGGDQILARFHHERATLARLEHPGIARLLDGGATEDGRPWLATEYVEGRPFDVWARGASAAERLEAFLSVCDAVAAAHRALVVHRDIKPANVVVDKTGTPRLLDFGVAKALGSDELDGEAEDGAPLDDASLITRDGRSPLTPAYASPEQLAGDPAGPASDVYALGVMLHELLTDRRPQQGAIHAAPLSRDHAAILAKALAHDPAARYARADELADDLRRSSAHLPIAARGDAWTYRARCFARRHRVAVAMAVAALAFAVIAVVQSYQSLQLDRERLLDILRLSDGYTLQGLQDEMDTSLWPPRDNADALDAWLGEAQALVSRRARHGERLDELSSRIAAGDADDDTLWWHGQLSELTAALDAFTADDPFGHTLASVDRRRRLHDEILDASLRGDAAEAWRRATAEIGDRDANPIYDGLALSPQWGLVPLGRDDSSGLWEFVDVQTGVPPTSGEGAGFAIGDETALVFVLLPGGTFTMGSGPGDPWANPDEPAHTMRVAPFFLAKHEMTQGQWARVTGRTPSNFLPPAYPPWPVSAAHPVEQISWDDARETLRRLGWVLPTEAQWEYAARAGTTTTWSNGDDPEALDDVANLADLDARDGGGSTGWSYVGAERHGLRDGHVIHAPVGSFAPNPFGLHDMHGNLWEWCREMPAPYLLELAIRGDGERVVPDEIPDTGSRVLRGGAYSNPPEELRSAKRWSAPRDFSSQVVGVRPARAIEP